MIYATEQQVVVTAVLIVVVALVAMFAGMWWGMGRGLEQAAEEQRWEREQAAARRAHPAYRKPRRCAECGSAEVAYYDPQGRLWCRDHGLPDEPGPERVPVLEPTEVISPEDVSVSAWTARMAADMDQFLDRLIGGTDQQLREITR